MENSYANPYDGHNFWQFILLFLQRLFEIATGRIGVSELATDEIQIFVLAGVAASGALVGTFLVLRKMTMLANSLSHTILLGIVAVYVMTQNSIFGSANIYQPINISMMLFAALIMGLLTTFLTELLTKTLRLQEDASIGLIFTGLFALGIILVTLLTRNAHIGTEVVMGNVDALHRDDLQFVFIILFINIFLTFLFFKEYTITTFDPNLSRSFGISVTFYNYLLMAQASATTIGAFRAVGVLMILAFITGPVLTARLFTHRLERLIVISIAIGCLASFVGVALSRHLLTVYGLALSTGGIVVCVIGFFFLIAAVWNKLVSQKIIKELQQPRTKRHKG